MTDDDLGPAKPIYEPELYPCGQCGKLNINRFNCTKCLEELGAKSFSS